MIEAFKNTRFSDLIDRYAPAVVGVIAACLGAVVAFATGMKGSGG